MLSFHYIDLENQQYLAKYLYKFEVWDVTSAADRSGVMSEVQTLHIGLFATLT
jgi:hypothetical protein